MYDGARELNFPTSEIMHQKIKTCGQQKMKTDMVGSTHACYPRRKYHCVDILHDRLAP